MLCCLDIGFRHTVPAAYPRQLFAIAVISVYVFPSFNFNFAHKVKFVLTAVIITLSKVLKKNNLRLF